MLHEQRGTCSTKHLFIAQTIAKRYPDTRPQIIHRVYTVTPEGALRLFGEEAAARVPAEGLVDVHRYLTIQPAGRRIPIDATFPGAPWDGRSPLPLARERSSPSSKDAAYLIETTGERILVGRTNDSTCKAATYSLRAQPPSDFEALPYAPPQLWERRYGGRNRKRKRGEFLSSKVRWAPLPNALLRQRYPASASDARKNAAGDSRMLSSHETYE